MTKENYARAYVEVLACLKLLKEEEYDRIPENIIKYFEENKDNNYNFDIDANTLNETRLSDEANAINLYIYMNYFSTEDINKKIRYQLSENERKYQEKLSEKYSVENLFKNNKRDLKYKKGQGSQENMQMVEFKESVFTRLMKKVKKIFNKSNN